MQSSSRTAGRFVIIVGNDSGDDDTTLITSEVFHISLEQEDRVVVDVEALPTRMRHDSAACTPPAGRPMYVTGVGKSKKETWKWDAESSWKRCADMIEARRRYGAVFVNNSSMYVLGGMIGGEATRETITRSVEEYNVDTDTWRLVGKLKYPTCLAACAVHHNSIYIFGGRYLMDKSKRSKSTLSCVQVFDKTANVCSELSVSLPRPMQMTRAVKWDKYVIIVGKTDSVVFDLDQKTFQQRNQFAAGVLQFGLVLDGQRLFLIGGHTKECDAHGAVSRPSRDDVKTVDVKDIINNVSPARWTRHASLPQPTFAVHGFTVYDPTGTAH